MHVSRIVPVARDWASATPPSGNVRRQSTVPAPGSAITSSEMSTAPVGVSSRARPSPADKNACAHRGRLPGSLTKANTLSGEVMISIPWTSNIFIVTPRRGSSRFKRFDDGATDIVKLSKLNGTRYNSRMSRLATLAFSAVLFTAVAVSAQDTARMEQVIQSHVSAGTFMGTVLVARDGAAIVDKAYGMANVEWEVPNTTVTKFRLGSITKQFTAAAILLLEERGKLKVDDRVKSYLPDSPMAWDRITIFNLLTHTAGIPNFTSWADYNTIKLSARSADAAVTAFRDRPLDFGPGEQMSYSNSGYLVLG